MARSAAVKKLPTRKPVLPDAEWQLITPEYAQELLDNNDVNRNRRPAVVEAYASDMANGLWGTTAEPIQISRTGRLLNGQHRMLAVIKAEVSIWMLVVTGLDDNVQVLMDQGAARSPANALQMMGVKNASNAASLARWLSVAPEPVVDMERLLKKKTSTAQVVRTFEEQIEDITAAVAAFHGLRNHIPASPTALTYSWLIMHRVDPADCKLFYNAMVDMTFPALHDPRKAVLRRLQSEASEPGSSSSKDKAVATVSVLTRGWNAWRKGEELSTIPARGKGGKIIAPVVPV